FRLLSPHLDAREERLALAGPPLLHRREGHEEHEGRRAEHGSDHAGVEDVVGVARAADAHEEDAEQGDPGADRRVRTFGPTAHAAFPLVEGPVPHALVANRVRHVENVADSPWPRKARSGVRGEERRWARWASGGETW